MSSRHHPNGLAGARVLLVEDEPLVSLLAEDMLYDLGCAEVWHACDLASARELLEHEQPHCAVLDVNLSGELVFPLAERLHASGIPFVFVTGYGRRGIPPRWSAVPVIAKPYDRTTFATGLLRCLQPAPPHDNHHGWAAA